MPEPLSQQTTPLVPKLTNYDRRLIRACPEWSIDWRIHADEPRERATAWEVAKQLHEYDVGLVLRTLKALEDFGHIYSNGHYMPHKRIFWREDSHA